MTAEYHLTEIKNKISGRTTHLIITRKPLVEKDLISKRIPVQSRIDLVPEETPLQAAILMLRQSTTFIPHIHFDREIASQWTRTVEAWIVLQGSVDALLYDKQGTLVHMVALNATEIVMTIDGGHNYVSRDDNTIVLEMKSGPYDQERDKVRFTP